MEKNCCFTNGNNWFRYRTGAIIIEDNKLLFVGSKGVEYLYTIGGGVHMGETAENCVCREVFEETGVRYEIDRLALICENFFKGKGGSTDGLDCHCLEFYFIMKSKGSAELHSNSVNCDGDREEMVWIPADEIGEHNIKPSFLKERIDDILYSREILHIVTEADR